MGTDNFNRGDNADIAASAPVAWVQVESPDGNVLRVITNALRVLSSISSGSVYGGYATDPSVTSNNQSAQLEFVDITANCRSGVGVRMSGASAATFTGYILIYNGTDIRLYKYANQDLRDTAIVGTLLATAAETLAATDELYLQAVGTQLVARKNGTLLFSAVTDADIATGGAGPVVIGTPNTATSAGNWDNWEGTDDPQALSSGGKSGAWLQAVAPSGIATGIGTGT